jgi:(p)ppGpp synthase/HD superfamily hydrolase
MRLVAMTLTESSEGRAEAIAFLIDAYDGVRTAPGKGLPHAEAVADILRDAGYDQSVQVVGLLHDVVEDTPRTIQDVRDGFGETIAAMVEALTEDDSIHTYAQRKRGLRAQVIGAGTTVMDIALADKIASLEYARITATRVRSRKLAHYEATLQLAVAAGADERCAGASRNSSDNISDSGANEPAAAVRRRGRRCPPLTFLPAGPLSSPSRHCRRPRHRARPAR